MKILLALLLLVWGAQAAESDSPTPLGHVQEGVYWAHGSRTTNILELKEGRFRRWSASLRGSGGGRGGAVTNSSLEAGFYTTNGGTATIVVPSEGRLLFRTNRYTFMKDGNGIKVWDSNAQKVWAQSKVLYPMGIFEPTDRKPEDIMQGK